MRTRLTGVLLVAAIIAVPAAASALGPTWRTAQRWDDLTTEQKSRAIENYQRYKSLPPEKQRNLEQRYERWKNLPSADKDRYRQKFRDSDGD